jgi:hypothetical protein
MMSMVLVCVVVKYQKREVCNSRIGKWPDLGKVAYLISPDPYRSPTALGAQSGVNGCLPSASLLGTIPLHPRRTFNYLKPKLGIVYPSSSF